MEYMGNKKIIIDGDFTKYSYVLVSEITGGLLLQNRCIIFYLHENEAIEESKLHDCKVIKILTDDIKNLIIK